MKKYLVLALLTIALSGLAFLAPEISESNARKVSFSEIKDECYVEEIVCSGKVVNSKNLSINSEFPFVVEKVMVPLNSIVEVNQQLIKVNKNATLKLAGDTNLLPLESIIGQIPDYITSSQRGRVSEIKVFEGAAVGIGDELMKISGEKSLRVKLNINENNISNVKTGQKMIISGNAFGDKKYNAILSEISNEAKSITTNSFLETVVEAWADIEDIDDTLKSGYTVKANITVKEISDATIVPYEAVFQDSDNNKFVYKIIDNWAVKQYISTISEAYQGVVISNGVAAGDKVVTDVASDNESLDFFMIKSGDNHAKN